MASMENKGKMDAGVLADSSLLWFSLNIYPALLPKCQPTGQQHRQTHLREREREEQLSSCSALPPMRGPSVALGIGQWLPILLCNACLFRMGW